MSNKDLEKIEVENINVPGYKSNVNAVMYIEMKKVLLKVLPESSPGLSHKEIQEKILPHLSEELFPGGQKIAWWSKTVQLDLEAKNLLVRELTKPMRWFKTNS